MKITLRKANALQTSIQDQIKTIEVATSVSLNEFQTPESELESARLALVTGDQRRDGLTKALYAIRSAVGRANVVSGVSDLLTQAAYVDKRIGHLKGFVDSTVVESLDVIKGKLSKIAESEKSSRMYGYNDTVNTGILAQDQINAFRKNMLEFKKLKQTLNDKVLELNVRTEIEIDADTLAVLQSEQLV
jgi:hypothetical protein